MICGTKKKPLARKYARAFLHVFKDLLQEDLFQSIEALTSCCKDNPLVFHTLLLSSARLEDKRKGLQVIADRLNLITPMLRLLETLLCKKKLDILPTLLPIIKEEYKKNCNYHDVVITSAHPLSANEQRQLEQALHTHLSGTLAFVYQEDDSLIAGVRIQTPTHYWEHSVAKMVRILENRLSTQEEV